MPEGHLPDPLYIWLNAGLLCPRKQDMRNWKKPVEYMTCALKKNHTSGDMERLVRTNFPSLVGQDLSR